MIGRSLDFILSSMSKGKKESSRPFSPFLSGYALPPQAAPAEIAACFDPLLHDLDFDKESTGFHVRSTRVQYGDIQCQNFTSSRFLHLDGRLKHSREDCPVLDCPRVDWTGPD
jgi:hypothetical protein